MKKFLFLLLLVAAVVALSVYPKWQKSDAVVAVQTAPVASQLIESTVLATGILAYGDSRSVRSEVTALVKSVAVEEGEEVTQGQELVQLDSESIETDLNSQKVSIALRKIEIERAGLRLKSLKSQQARLEKLYAQQATQISTVEENRDQISLAEVDLRMQQQLLVQAELSLHKVQDLLDKTVIRAPVDGLISALDIKVGEMAVAGGQGLPLLVMVDPSVIYTDIEVDEADIGGVTEGQQVRVFAVSFPDVAIMGVVETIATSARNVAGRNTLVFPVRVRIDDTYNIKLRPGMSTRSEILQPSDSKQLAVPIESVRDNSSANVLADAGGEGVANLMASTKGAGFSVFLYDNGIAREVTVTLGQQDDRYQAILTGLSLGDEVLIGPYRVLRTMRSGDPISRIPAEGQ